METKIGEAQGKKSIKAISTTDELKVLLRVIWKRKSEEVTFSPIQDIKTGDELKITVVKVSESTGAQGEAAAE